MAAIDWNAVTAVAAGLTKVPDDARTVILSHVNTALDVRRFSYGETDPRLRLARIYLAAHFATVSLPSSGASGPAGPVTSESAGGLSRSYGQLSASDTDPLLEFTSYGRMYRLIMRPLRGGIAL